jgi:hypothetical protein
VGDFNPAIGDPLPTRGPKHPASAREEAIEKAESGGNEGMGDQLTAHPGLLGYTPCMIPEKMHAMIRVCQRTGSKLGLTNLIFLEGKKLNAWNAKEGA